MGKGRSLFSLCFLAALLAVDCDSISAGDGPLNVLGYIVNVQLSCPKKASDRGFVEITAERPLFAMAKCENGVRNFTYVNGATSRLIIDPEGSLVNNPLCRLYKKAGSMAFFVELNGGWGEKGNEVMMPELRRTIFCNYDNYTLSIRKNAIQIQENIIAPKVIMNNLGHPQPLGPFGKYHDRVAHLHVVDIFDRKIDGTDFNMGRLVRLKAYHTDPNVFIKPYECIVENSLHKGYKFLRAGCGDGVVLNKSAGFQYDKNDLDGNTVYSPYFTAFTLPGTNNIFFECEFIVCHKLCGENSCENEKPNGRRKRDATIEPEMITTHSKYVIMKDPNDDGKSPIDTLGVVPYRYRKPGTTSKTNLLTQNGIAIMILLLVASSLCLLITMVSVVYICRRHTSATPAPHQVVVVPSAKPTELNNNIPSAA